MIGNPTSITSVFLKICFLFVKIRSMQVGFEDWKQVGFFIKHSRSNVIMKFLRLLLSIVIINRYYQSLLSIVIINRLKHRINTVLSYWQDNWPNVFDKWLKKHLSFWDGGVYRATHSHLWFLTVNSNRINSMFIGMDTKDKTLLGICSLT